MVGGRINNPCGNIFLQRNAANFFRDNCRSQNWRKRGSYQASKAATQSIDETHIKYALLIAYDGTDYGGWQLQLGAEPNKNIKKGPLPSVQGKLENALCTFTQQTRERLKVQAAGRTDAGVHARGQIIQCTLDRHIEPDRVVCAVNGLLPHDIRAQAAVIVPSHFNVRYASSKSYHYDIHLGRIEDPLLRRFRHHPARSDALDVVKMEQAANVFIGTHDFSAFCKISKDNLKGSPVRTITEFGMETLPYHGVRFVINGKGFLHKQVRYMIGALEAIGNGKMSIDDLKLLLMAGHSQSGKALHWNVAQARGLCLHEVEYDESPFKESGAPT